MKKLTLLSVAAAALLFVGCGEKKTESNATESNTTTEVNTTTTTEVNTTTAPEANTTTAPEANATAAAPTTAAPAAYAACSACHGVDGKTVALGKSAVIAGQAAADIETKLKAYKAGTRDVTGMGATMKPQAANLSDDQIKALADYISKL